MTSPLQVAHPPDRLLLIFDGNCRFCRRWAVRWQRLVGDRGEAVPSQRADLADRFPELTGAALETAVHLVEPDGRVTRGAEAVCRSVSGVWRGPRWLYEHLPGFAPWSERLYAFVARRRRCVSQSGCPGLR